MRKSLSLLIIFSLLFISCAKKITKPVNNPGNLYVEGVELMKKKKYEAAIADFAKVRENFPFDPIAVVAQVKQGDAYFEKKDYQPAANTYEDFVNSYPDDENAAYALGRLAECYEKQSPTLDRDQAITVKAVERFTFLKNRYPTSPYAKDAESHIKQLTLKLAGRELYVGEFYYKAGSYNASILRLEYFLKTYPEGSDRDRALHYLAEDYRELNKPDKERYYLDRLRKEYPGSIYARQIRNERKAVSTLAVSTPQTAQTPPAAPPVAPPSAPAAAVQPVQQEATPASGLTYEEKKKREIDLRPPEPSPPPKEGPIVAQAQVEGGVLPGSGGGESSSRAAPSSKTDAVAANDADTVKSASLDGASAADKAVVEPEKVEAGESNNDKKEEPGGKKNGLAFFTKKKPVDVVSDTMEAFEKGKTIVFKGNVVAQQEGSEPGQTLFLFSDTLTAYRTDESSDIQQAVAEGNVKVVKAQRTATCKQAFFYNDKGEVVLKGDVVVFEGNDRLTGDVATYYLNEDRVYVQGDKDQRAHVIVTPKK